MRRGHLPDPAPPGANEGEKTPVTEAAVDEAVPTEDDTLLGGESGNEFDIDIFDIRVKAGRYDGWLMPMQALLHDRGILENTRRWRCEFNGETYDEEMLSGESADHAERFAIAEGQKIQGWGLISAFIQDNVRRNIGPPRAVLYGICRGELGMTDLEARRAIKLPAAQIMACFSWYDLAESPGKDEAST